MPLIDSSDSKEGQSFALQPSWSCQMPTPDWASTALLACTHKIADTAFAAWLEMLRYSDQHFTGLVSAEFFHVLLTEQSERSLF